MDRYELAKAAVRRLCSEITDIDYQQRQRPDVQEWLETVYVAVASLQSVYTLRDVEGEVEA